MDLVCVLLLFPLVIWLGAHLPSPRWLRPLYVQAGRLSYGIYILHAPVVLVTAGAYKAIWHADPAAMRPYSGIAFAAISLAVAALAVQLFDEPVRRRLGRALASRSAKPARPTTALMVPK
jgi:peptidoglycan/LPS O-acetylase OafA/YrhL